ncbi:MAG: hypothetical protein LW636_09960, partial [Planctomycetaceae bacterium]|nr:hypothetical protein [Planctomycetaceae bacterium]
MLAWLQRLFLGLSLIAAAAAVLVLTDRSGERRAAGPQADGPAKTDSFDPRKRSAIIKYAS